MKENKLFSKLHLGDTTRMTHNVYQSRPLMLVIP